jgi:YfiH family protein
MIYAQAAIGNIPVAVAGRSQNQVLENPNGYAGLNLSGYVGDDPLVVRNNREILMRTVGATSWATVTAEHSNVVHQVSAGGEAPPGDALITTVPGLALMALSADCVPIAIGDERAGIVAVVHAGWKGLVSQVANACVEAMVDLGASPDQLVAILGPSICGSCYEVPNERVELVRSATPEACRDETHLDIAAGIKAQLAQLGVRTQQIAGCTYEDAHLFSYRRAVGTPTGRGGIAIALPTSAS